MPAIHPLRAALLLLALASAAPITASAAALALRSPTLSAGTAIVGRCDTAVTAALVTSGSSVTAATVRGVSDACNGARLAVTLVDGTGAARASGSVASVSVPSGGGTVSVNVTPNNLPASTFSRAHVSMVGP